MLLKLENVATPGALITFCGLDGCGKTTMIKKLSNELQSMGVNLYLTKQPTEIIRNNSMFRQFQDTQMKDTGCYRSMSLLCASDRLYHSNQVILPMLNKGKTVISDRYFYSCFANLLARGYTKDKWIYEVAAHIPRPDISFFLDCDVDVAISRVKQRPAEKNNYIDEEFQKNLRNQYLHIASQVGGIIVRTNDHKEEAYNIVKGVVIQCLNSKNILVERSFINV